MLRVGTAALVRMQALVREQDEALAAAQLGLHNSMRASQRLQQHCSQLEHDAVTLRSAAVSLGVDPCLQGVQQGTSCPLIVHCLHVDILPWL